MNYEVGDYLYHYTNLCWLALILKNRTIRFNSLCNMDDQEEKIISGLKEYGKYCFVSSWTNCADEKLSLWSMYTYNMSGVRIKLHTLPFETYTWSVHEEHLNMEMQDNFWPRDWFNYDSYVPVANPNEKFLVSVEYTDDEDMIVPNILQYDEKTNETKIALDLLGKYKRKEWDFQDEIRYRMTYLPYKLSDCMSGSQEQLKQILLQQPDLPFTDRYLRIKEEYFNEIEIMTGPKMNEGEKEMLHLLVEKYCPTATIVESKFTNKIR